MKNWIPSGLKRIKQSCSARLNPIPQRYGPEFMHRYRSMQESQWWSGEKLQSYQIEHLKALLMQAYENVPYYREKFREIGFNPGDVKNLNHLTQLPLLDKETITEHFEDFKAQNIKQFKPVDMHTSGTSGQPFHFLVDQGSALLERALAWRHWNWTGYQFGEKRATFRQYLGQNMQGSSKWYYDPVECNLSFFSFEVGPNIFEKCRSKIKKIRPKMIRGYPSFISSFATYLNENNHTDLHFIDAVVCASEMLYPHQRRDIERAFKCEVFNWYGCGENVCSACECEKHEGLHVNMERGIIEILKNGKTAYFGEVGEIVATGLHNYSMPLIRYRVKDLAAYKRNSCSCGRGSPLLASIQGRESEIIIGKGGKYYFPAGIIDLIDEIYNIKDSQLFQHAIDQFTIKIVKNTEYIESDTQQLLKNMRSVFGESAKIEVKFVEKIEKTEAGKYRWFISKVSDQVI